MNERRRRWFEQALARDNRIIDTQVMNGLQNGTAFFASTSLIAVGGAVTLLGATDQIMQVRSDFPLSGITTRLGFEDASTFYRAFRKWTGSAPGAWRSAQQAPALPG